MISFVRTLSSSLKRRVKLPVLSVSVRIAMYSFCALCAVSATWTYYYAVEGWVRQNRRVEKSILSLKTNLRYYLNDERFFELKDRLRQAYGSGDIAFYYILKDRKLLAYQNMAHWSDEIVLHVDLEEGRYLEKGYFEEIIRNGEYVVIFGDKEDFSAHIAYIFDEDKLSQMAAIILLTALILLIASLSNRALDLALSRLSQINVRRGGLDESNSREAMLIQRALYAAEDESRRQRILLDKFVATTPAALLDGMLSGAKLPAQIPLTLVMIDINGFTKGVMGGHEEETYEFVAEFTRLIRTTLARWGGLYQSRVGDAFVFYVRDDLSPNSCATALAALYALMDGASEFKRRFEKLGLPFTLKASLSHGLLRVDEIDGGYEENGRPFIYCARYLSTVEEKSRNTIVFNETLREKLSHLQVDRFHKEASLKGIENEVSRLFISESQISVENHLGVWTEESFRRLYDYRSDRDLEIIFGFLNLNFNELDGSLVRQVLTQFETFHSARGIANSAQQAYVELVRTVLTSAHGDQGDDLMRTASLAVAMSVKFITSPRLKLELEMMLVRALEIDNERLQANSIEALGVVAPNLKLPRRPGSEIIRHRSAANLCIKDARSVADNDEWKRLIRRPLAQLLMNSRPMARAAGYYALGEVALIARNRDPIAFVVNQPLHEFLNYIAHALTDENEHIRAQALKAAWKSGRMSVIQEVLESQSMSPELRSELSSFYDRNSGLDPLRIMDGLLSVAHWRKAI